MDIFNAKTAREFVAAWNADCKSAYRRARMFEMARESMLRNAGLDYLYGRKKSALDHHAAAHVLDLAERAALVEALGWAPEGKSAATRYAATTGEMKLWAKEGRCGKVGA